jgi:putative DNA methylase
MITKVLTELLPAVAGQASVAAQVTELAGADESYAGVVADIRHYGAVVRERVQARLREHFATSDATTLAWLWCRTVDCPNPACGRIAPLIDSTVISRTGAGAHIDVSYSGTDRTPTFDVLPGVTPAIAGTVERAGASCIACGSPIPFSHIRAAGHEHRLGFRAMAKVRSVDRSRQFVAVPQEEEALALGVSPIEDPPDVLINPDGAGIRVPLYGIERISQLFTPRQLVVLSAFAGEVAKLEETLQHDGASDAQRKAIIGVLGLCVGKLSQASSTLVRWNVRRGATAKAEPAFARHDMAMTWDFAETNPFGGSVGDWSQIVQTSLRAIPFAARGTGHARADDARTALRRLERPALVATDPPYFDQIGYADLSDYFYVWLRRALRPTFPDLFATVATPKADELIALPSRHDGKKDRAKKFFVDGFSQVFEDARQVQIADAPSLVVYAFKEQGSAAGEDIAPGWEAILESLIAAGMSIVGTWPVRGARLARMVGINTNSLATYVVMVCRPRGDDAARITKSDLVRLLRESLTDAVAELQHANIAPVDLAQAVIGPGMQVFSRHSAVVETDGSRVGVAEALALINRTLAEIIDEQEGDLDPDSRWAVTWYEQHGFAQASFGEADQLARPKGIAVDSLQRAGIITSGGNRVQLISRDALPADWDPATDRRATAWEAVHHLARALEAGGESAAADLYARLGPLRDSARELAYRLFRIADKNGSTEDAIAYNSVVSSWPEFARLAESRPSPVAASATTEALF